MQPRQDDRAPSELLGELSQQLSDLVHKEIALAQTEMVQKAMQAGTGAGLLLAGGALAYFGSLALEASVILMLAKVLPRWLSAAFVGTVLSGAGGYLALRGITELRRADLVPRQTIQTLKENATWLKAETR
jgi:hypothetical protein